MSKYKDIIESLTFDEKIKIVKNLKSFNPTENTVLPNLKIANINAIGTNEYKFPLCSKFSSCWDDELIQKYFTLIGHNLKTSSSNYNIVRGVNSSIFDQTFNNDRITEDDYLLSRFLNAYIEGFNRAGILPIVTDYTITKYQLPYLDTKFNERAVRDSFLKPFKYICQNPNKFIVETNGSAYNNDEYLLNALYKDYKFDSLLINKNGNILSYNKMPYEIDDYNNLNENELDLILEKLLSSIYELDGNYENTSEEESIKDVVYDLTLKSTVLLKNEGILPLKTRADIIVVTNKKIKDSDITTIKNLYYKNANIEIVDKQDAKGIRHCNSNSYVLFFIDEKNIEKYCISKDDLSLIKNLNSKGANIIGVITNSSAIDTSFDSKLVALFKACNDEYITICALLDIIFGKFSPVGKTNITYPNKPQELEEELKNAKQDNKLIGELIGYKYYEKVNEMPKYPFGYGLSYANFEFSNFNYKKEEITFVIKNKSNFKASETVQIYIGLENSAVPRANKKLVNYKFITLNANESRQIKIKLNYNDFASFNPQNDKYEIEKGIYDIFVNTSCTEHKLTWRVALDGSTFKPLDNEIGIDKKYSKEKNKSKTLLNVDYFKNKTIQIIKNNKVASITLFVLWILSLVGVICSLHNPVILTIFVLVLVTVMIGNAFFIRFKINDSKLNLNPDVNVDELFNQNDTNETLHYETDFEKEITHDNDISNYKNTKIIDLFSQIYHNLKTKGILLPIEDLKDLMYSISTSRITIVQNNNQILFNELVDVLNTTFGSNPLASNDYTNKLYKNSIFKNDDDTYNNLYKGIISANDDNQQIKFISLTGLNSNNINYFDSIFEDSPYFKNSTNLKIGHKDIKLPKNLWYFFSYEGNIKNIPSELMSKATVINVNLEKTISIDENLITNDINYLSFINLIRLIKSENHLSLSKYKTLDNLQEFIKENSNFEFDNKFSSEIDNIVGVSLLFANQEAFANKDINENKENYAIDNLLSIKIVPLIYSLFEKEKLTNNAIIETKIQSLFENYLMEKTTRVINNINKKVDL